MFVSHKSHYNGHGIKLVRPLSTVDNTRDFARVSHSIDSGLTITYTSRLSSDLFKFVISFFLAYIMANKVVN